MRRITTLLLQLACVAIHAFSAPIDSLTARHIAKAFLASHAAENTLPGQKAPSSVSFKMEKLNRAYLVQSSSDFVLVSTDDAFGAIMGYGSNSFSAGASIPPALQAMLTSGKALPTAMQQATPTHFTPVAPLLSTVRHQYAPYNNYCPTYRSGNGTTAKCLVGCVATAMEQIITYHRPVITLLDTLHGQHTDYYDAPEVLPGERLDTRLIRNDYDHEPCTADETDAVARLCYWLGLAAQMQWGPGASGAYSAHLVEPLRSAFGFPYVHYLEKRKYDPEAFWQFMAQEIMAHRPVYYAGAIMQTGGHAFVLDGLDEDGLFHVNWGYGGDFDGFFRLDVLSYAQPESERKDHPVDDGFLADQEAIVLSVQPVSADLPDTLQRHPDDISVSEVQCLLSPSTNRLTPIRLHLRNTSATQAFYHTIGLLEMPQTANSSDNAETTWLALTACQLQPQEETDLTVHVLFTHSGSVMLGVTPDGENITSCSALDVAAGGTQAFLYDTPQVSVRTGSMVVIHQGIRNASASERAAQRFLYDLLDEDTQTSVRTTHALYLSPGESITDSVSFTNLTPGHTYTLRLRERWPIVQQVTFTLPLHEGIEYSPASNETENETWYSLDGRRLTDRPQRAGIYLLKKGAQMQKVIRKSRER